ncbi:type II glyceraldehyde-3-phosphate dehydrogenase [Phototrophicus methaneseepsis]|uniref:Type II glyceraldehyde-3-phosphate dehydrogenase n=1 Tax=Phototrophicus methaneseepsis TaxID=2710758 RepID=A0A7S8IF45_9CHLR|nr:type II glyceraldehyde-3-phosphate dehydrogenase [Phototrophicus methaneseepsis]QPC83129.1 type II glyceraldehyde-3-phosphate dehydrogenase [Phototrophicus methaneseepsis]
MSNQKVRVIVNGYGVIGKRIADAVVAQDDMELVGIADVVSDWRIKIAVEKGYPVFASNPEAVDNMRTAGIPLVGTLDDLLKQVDIVADATPKKVASANLEKYRAAGVKSIFQGGEKHSLTGHSFVAQANYNSAIGRDTTRVVSCNTTSIVRTLGALKQAGLLKKARGVLIRRATDPWESDHSGVMNTIVPETTIPSHQGPDAQTVVPDLDVVTIAVVAAHTTSHLHTWSVELTHLATKDEVLAAFRVVPRIAFLQAADGVVALNSTLEMMADLGRPRGDMWEVGLWEDSLTVKGNELFYNYQVYNQAIVVPETIDAIRALTGIEQDGMRSIAKTDQAMGLVRDFVGRHRVITN